MAPPNRFIRIGNRDLSSSDIEKEAQSEAQAQSDLIFEQSALAVKGELEALLEDLKIESGKRDAAFQSAYAKIGKTTFRPAMEGLKVEMTKQDDKYIIRVVGSKNPNAFDALDKGAPPRLIPPRRVSIFPRYEGNIVSPDSRGNKSISVSRSNIRYTGELVFLHGRKPGYRKGFTVRRREPRNLYNRVIITLRNQSKLFRVVRGSAREWELRYIPRTAGRGAELFDASRLKIRAVIK